ncbi:MAG: DNA polymerase III delta prime subunit [uncultured Thermomicrobiales bacterium]|uniref:DNA polymerase III delta prime subunit n=1 Tax=uncultured Thermomicrobiales bacterium TaxID=1645740 RepID=A0A6J4UXS2_9BACT|nr:MAG: DNA polymerase III delta prime subunit [uncultured Thermomicrobiales bacterium]
MPPMSDNEGMVLSRSWGLHGQERLVTDFRRAVVSAPRHAYVVTGPPQSGKRTLAVAFAKAMNCTRPPVPGEFCGECGICRRIDRGVFPDVTVFDLATQADRERTSGKNLTLTIATVRDVSSQIAYRPSESRWKIIIVDDIESMQETAQEAFLKTLEEPPAYAVILLLTADADLLLPTIRSRCVTVRMQVVNEEVIRGALAERGVTGEDAAHIAALSDGRVGWAITAANDRALLERGLADQSDTIEWVKASQYQRLLHAWMLAEEFSKDRESVFRRLLAAQRLWRALLYRRHGVVGVGTIVDIDLWPTGTASLSGMTIVRAMTSLDECLTDLEANVRPRLALQTMVMAWPELSR